MEGLKEIKNTKFPLRLFLLDNSHKIETKLCIFFFLFQKHLLQPASAKITGTFWRSNFTLIYSGKINICVIFAVDEILKFGWTYFCGSQLFIYYTK